MGHFLRRAAGSAFLFLVAGLAWAAPPQLLLPQGNADRPPLAEQAWSDAAAAHVPGFATPGVKAKFNSPAMLKLQHGDEVELTLPDASRHPFLVDLIEIHRDGVQTFFGTHRDLGNRHRVIVTMGPTGSFAVFSTPQGEYRLVPGPEGDVLIDMTAEQMHLPIIRFDNDVRISPAVAEKDLRRYAPESYLALAGVNSLPMTKVAPTSGNVVDIMFVVTQTLANDLGSSLLTRLQFLVARANASYADSDVAIRLRYVHHVVVNYTDGGDNGLALAEISPSCAARPSGFCDASFNSSVFGTIESLRTARGADVVALLRDGSETGGSGIAWLGQRNAGSTAITNPSFMYSVTTGCVRACESVFIHEVGHNFGLHHDRATDAWQSSTGGRPYPPAGQYNYGYYYCASGGLTCNPEVAGNCTSQPECADSSNAGNFKDLMAYFHGSTVNTYKFSNPNVTCIGEPRQTPAQTPQPCGQANLADNARWMNEVRAALSAIRATAGGTYTDGSSSVTGWPPANAMPAGFTSSGNAWTAATDRVFEGTHSLRSAQVYAPSFAFPPSTYATSDLIFSGSFNAGTLSFMYQVSGWGPNGMPYGAIEFSVDDVAVLADTGESGWQFFAYPISAGNHTLRWRFKNAAPSACNGSGFNPPAATTCADRAWIDAVSLPLALATSTTALTSSQNPSASGASVTFTATVTGGSGTPTGTVDFRNGAASISGCGAVALASGSAQCSTSSLPVGSNTITAAYSGNATYLASTSSAVSQVVTSGPQLLSADPSALAFGGQSMNTTSPAQTTTITNTSGSPVTVTSVTPPAGYSVIANNCTTIPASGTCQISVAFTPPVLAIDGPVDGALLIAYAGGGPTGVALTGTAERSLVTHYYRSILRRAPDQPGKDFWLGEALRVQGLGASINEVWYAMAMSFYFSVEYGILNRDNAGFLTDLYNTFFNRPPDQAGFDFWMAQMAGGMPREGVLVNFMFSPEFSLFTQAIFGTPTARAEVNTVVDFYRGLLSRLPDTAGFNFYVQQFRTAQCQGAGPVFTQAENISSGYANGTEYSLRGRSNAQYMADLYNAFLRRGPDLAGINFYVNQLNTGGKTRDQVRVEFKTSPEFNNRVTAIIAETCIP